MYDPRNIDKPTYLKDTGLDALSHPKRADRIHIFSLDSILTDDIYDRISCDRRLARYLVIKPREQKLKKLLKELDSMAKETVSAKIIILDVRRDTLPMLQKIYNKIVGYNRRDFNKICYTLLVGDGPTNMFQPGVSLEVFAAYLATRRVDYSPAAYFYDPFLHYDPQETETRVIGEEFVLLERLPQRFGVYFKYEQGLKVDQIRHYFRAVGKDEQVRDERKKSLRKMYIKEITREFPQHREQLKDLLSKQGLQVASERLHLYPLFFEDWIYDLTQKA